MYFPVLRGKQFELIALREIAKLELAREFRPIIEPVKKVSKPLIRTIKELNDNDVSPLVVINSKLGDRKEYQSFYSELSETDINFMPCIVYGPNESKAELEEIINYLGEREFSLFIKQVEEDIVDCLDKAQLLLLEAKPEVAQNVATQLQKPVVVIEDGFIKQARNADYPKRSTFSSAIADFKKYDLLGFGDYTITGSSYVEGGGPAYVVAIHLSQLLASKSIFSSGINIVINHFCSEDNGSKDDPAGKFFEALEKLNAYVQDERENLVNTLALQKFEQLHKEEHFPGLGAAKKLSISHHIETIIHFLQESRK